MPVTHNKRTLENIRKKTAVVSNAHRRKRRRRRKRRKEEEEGVSFETETVEEEEI